MITILSMVFVLGLLIFIHELGHFAVAKAIGVRVEKFSLGFGPKVFSFRRKDTEYMVSALPLGGYVKMAGDELGGELQSQPWEFLSRGPWARNLIVLAGPLMNLFLAFVLLSGIFMVGVPVFTSRVGEIKKGLPAEQAGLQPNDLITAIDGKPTKRWEDLVDVIYANPGKELEFQIQRQEAADAPAQNFSVRIKPKEETLKDLFGEKRTVGIIGITPTAEVLSERLGFFPAIGTGLRATGTMTWMTYKGLWMIVTRQVPANSIGGPLMIAKLAGESARKGILQLLHFTCIISVTLGVINLLPIPVLDGGHLMFFTIEALKGSPVSIRAQEISHRVGVFSLIALMLFATYNDIVRLFS